jgi:hypothetical protein
VSRTSRSSLSRLLSKTFKLKRHETAEGTAQGAGRQTTASKNEYDQFKLDIHVRNELANLL